jgi:hypothetical protein
MPFIKLQNVVKDEDTGRIISGSASVIDVTYVKTGKADHSKQKVREKLGQILFLADDRRSGVFISPTRGVVEYDADKDTFTDVMPEDERIAGYGGFGEPPIHVTMGSVDLAIRMMKSFGMTDVLRKVFLKEKDFQRCFGHILYTVLKNSERIRCDDFLSQTFAVHLLDTVSMESFRTDTLYFTEMGSDKVRVRFFKAFVEHMRRTHPDFGRACYVDSTPLPNDIDDNPFRAFSSHGSAGCDQSRMVLVLDEDSGLPVWYTIIPGNVVDVNTLYSVMEDVRRTLDIEMESFVLDSGYTSKELIGMFHIGSKKSMISKMPAREGYPFEELYFANKNLFGNAKYTFVRENHTYFGIRRKIELFGQPIYAYVYMDHENALSAFRTFYTTHRKQYDSMKDKDKTWEKNKGGYFVLLSNYELKPEELLDMYFARTRIESVFRSSKEYLSLLPLSKWTSITVNGKILNDIISLITYMNMRAPFLKSGISLTTVISRCRSLICSINNDGILSADQPSRNVREYFKTAGVKLQRQMDIHEYKAQFLESKCSAEI